MIENNLEFHKKWLWGSIQKRQNQPPNERDHKSTDKEGFKTDLYKGFEYAIQPNGSSLFEMEWQRNQLAGRKFNFVRVDPSRGNDSLNSIETKIQASICKEETRSTKQSLPASTANQQQDANDDAFLNTLSPRLKIRNHHSSIYGQHLPNALNSPGCSMKVFGKNAALLEEREKCKNILYDLTNGKDTGETHYNNEFLYKPYRESAMNMNATSKGNPYKDSKRTTSSNVYPNQGDGNFDRNIVLSTYHAARPLETKNTYEDIDFSTEDDAFFAQMAASIDESQLLAQRNCPTNNDVNVAIHHISSTSNYCSSDSTSTWNEPPQQTTSTTSHNRIDKSCNNTWNAPTQTVASVQCNYKYNNTSTWSTTPQTNNNNYDTGTWAKSTNETRAHVDTATIAQGTHNYHMNPPSSLNTNYAYNSSAHHSSFRSRSNVNNSNDTSYSNDAPFQGQPKNDDSFISSNYMVGKDTKDILGENRRKFGHHAFRAGQKEVIQAAVAGRDVFVLMPTGGGKSLCYQLPAWCCPGLSVVISPLLSLIEDQVQSMTKLGVESVFLTSAQEYDTHQRHIIQRLRQTSDHDSIKLLYITPEKIRASTMMQGILRDLANKNLISRFVIDEAHCLRYAK